MNEQWYVQLLFPLIRSKNPESELYSLKTNYDYDPTQTLKEFSP